MAPRRELFSPARSELSVKPVKMARFKDASGWKEIGRLPDRKETCLPDRLEESD